MEAEILFFLFAALAGMVTALFIGRDPWKLLSTSILIVPFVFPALGLVFESDPSAQQVRVDSMIEQIGEALPSVIVGEVIGAIAGAILRWGKDLVELFNGR